MFNQNSPKNPQSFPAVIEAFGDTFILYTLKLALFGLFLSLLNIDPFAYRLEEAVDLVPYFCCNPSCFPYLELFIVLDNQLLVILVLKKSFEYCGNLYVLSPGLRHAIPFLYTSLVGFRPFLGRKSSILTSLSRFIFKDASNFLFLEKMNSQLLPLKVLYVSGLWF